MLCYVSTVPPEGVNANATTRSQPQLSGYPHPPPMNAHPNSRLTASGTGVPSSDSAGDILSVSRSISMSLSSAVVKELCRVLFLTAHRGDELGVTAVAAATAATSAHSIGIGTATPTSASDRDLGSGLALGPAAVVVSSSGSTATATPTPAGISEKAAEGSFASRCRQTKRLVGLRFTS